MIALERAYKLARQALALDSTDYRVHLLLGSILTNRKQYAEALTHYQQAMALNSNDANGAAHMGNLFIAMGRFSEALDWLQRAVRLNPLHPAWYLYGIGEAHYGARQYEQAIAPCERLSIVFRPLSRRAGTWPPPTHRWAVWTRRGPK